MSPREVGSHQHFGEICWNHLPGTHALLALKGKRHISIILLSVVHQKALMYKVVQTWPGLIVCKQVTVCPGHIWTTLYMVRGVTTSDLTETLFQF
jgi:hypothetical protein